MGDSLSTWLHLRCGGLVKNHLLALIMSTYFLVLGADLVNFALLHFNMLLSHDNMWIFLPKCLLIGVFDHNLVIWVIIVKWFTINARVLLFLLILPDDLHAIRFVMASIWPTTVYFSLISTSSRLPTTWELTICVVIVLGEVHLFCRELIVTPRDM